MPRVGDPAQEQERVGIEDHDRVGKPEAEHATGPLPDLGRDLVARIGRELQELGGEGLEVRNQPAQDGAAPRPAVQQPARRAQDPVGPGIGFEAAAPAAVAGLAVRDDLGVADLAGRAGRATLQAAVDDQAPAHAGAQGHAEHVARPALELGDVSAPDRGVGVVLHDRGQAQPFAEGVPEGVALPAGQVGGQAQAAAPMVDVSGHAEAQGAGHQALRSPGLEHVADPAHEGRGAEVRLRGHLLEPEHVAGRRDGRELGEGPSHVHAESDLRHDSLHSGS